MLAMQQSIPMYRRSLENTLTATLPLLSKLERVELMSACGELGLDPSSEYFTKRTKNIAYVMCIEGQWLQLHADYFVQPDRYNDFSGGYKRYYREMPSQFLACEATQKVLSVFQAAYRIPDKEPILVQVQTSHVGSENADRCLTGQGIHTDGANRAMILCLERKNILGAENAIYADLNGDRALMKPFLLEEGQALLWHDNRVFHYVAPARIAVGSESAGERTVLIAHYPATHYLTGKINPNNLLGTNRVEKNRRLRDKNQAVP